MSRSIKARTAGFTLIEALVALAVVAASLGAIASLIAINVRASRSLDHRLALLEATRTILTGLPDRILIPNGSTGETAGHRWRVDLMPLPVEVVDPRRRPPWLPQVVVVRVQGPTGQLMRIDTVRLQPPEAVQPRQ